MGLLMGTWDSNWVSFGFGAIHAQYDGSVFPLLYRTE